MHEDRTISREEFSRLFRASLTFERSCEFIEEAAYKALSAIQADNHEGAIILHATVGIREAESSQLRYFHWNFILEPSQLIKAECNQ